MGPTSADSLCTRECPGIHLGTRATVAMWGEICPGAVATSSDGGRQLQLRCGGKARNFVNRGCAVGLGGLLNMLQIRPLCYLKGIRIFRKGPQTQETTLRVQGTTPRFRVLPGSSFDLGCLLSIPQRPYYNRPITTK